MPVEDTRKQVLRDSILVSVKKIVGVDEDCEDFDPELIMHINTVFFALNQMGIGTEGFMINGVSETWSSFKSGPKEINMHALKTYVGLRVKLIFDPPSSSIAMQALKENIAEYEWRMFVNNN